MTFKLSIGVYNNSKIFCSALSIIVLLCRVFISSTFYFNLGEMIISFRREMREPVVGKYGTKENLFLKF